MILRAACKVLLVVAAVMPALVQAQVKYDTGRMQINGVQLFQDYADPTAFYYLPPGPRLATNEDGTLQFLCLKYVDRKGDASGGLFHALVELTLPPDAVEALDKGLKKKISNARIVGAVPLMPAKKESDDQPGSFEVVSAILTNREKGGMTRSVVTSGVAPVAPGSRAAIAASLNPQGATLLWNSLSGPTSDVSVAINGYYEAVVTGFSAHVSADISTVYTHYSSVFNKQQDYTRRQIRDVNDSLIRNGTIKVETLDRGSALSLKTDDMASLLDVITQKLTELFFDHKTGFSADPEREAAVEAGQIPGRQERSWLSRTFGGTDDTKYYTDDQWVMKDRKDLRQNIFSITLDKNTTIKVPFSTAGNIRGLYGAFKDDPRYFRIVDLADPAYQTPVIYFQVDGNYADAFLDTINFVAINFRKRYEDPAHKDTNDKLHIDAASKNTGMMQSVNYPLLGETGASSQQYEYQLVWSIRDRNAVHVPGGEDWISSTDAIVPLLPPLQKVVVEIDADRQFFRDKAVASARLEFRYPLVGSSKTQAITLRPNDADSATKVTLYRDRGKAKIEYRISWQFKSGQSLHHDWKALDATADTGFLSLVPPDAPSTPPPTPGGGQ